MSNQEKEQIAMNNHTPNREASQRKKNNELNVIHPLVASWLTKNGYSYIHEYDMPDYGRVDFYATHPDGRKLLVEAKLDTLSKVMTQLAGYGVQMPEAQLAIAAPEDKFTEKAKHIAYKYNILVIPLEVTISREKYTQYAGNRLLSDGDIRDIVSADRIMRTPDKIVEFVKAWHLERDSNPLLDFIVLFHYANQSSPRVFSDDAVDHAVSVYADAFCECAYDKHPGYAGLLIEAVKAVKALAVLPRITGGALWE